MQADIQKYELTEQDLLGYVPEDLECRQCGGVFCGLRVGRILDGRPFIMCSRNEATKQVLASHPQSRR